MQNTYTGLNAQINLWDAEGKLQLGKDKEAARAYFLEHVNPNTVFFHDLEEKTEYLIDNGFWREDVVLRYGFDFLKSLMKQAYAHKFRFKTFLGALKFYSSYALRTEDGKRYLERYEDRVVLNALAFSEDEEHAKQVVDEIISGRFQPATPTFLNAGRVRGGKPVSCFILHASDNMESISRIVTDSLQLSKNGGGVGICITNIREDAAPIKGIEGQASGVIPIMKLLEDSFSYANQLGARQGAGAVYLNAHHPDILRFLDTKRENADEKVRIKTLSLGVIVPDITFELARKNQDMYLFSPYDVARVEGKELAELSVTENYDKWVADERITKKKINARKFFTALAEVQFESGYPYIMFEDTVNRANPAPNVGRIASSNLCSEIFQPHQLPTFTESSEFIDLGRDVSCNLGSLNIDKVWQNWDNVAQTVDTAYKFLNQVSEQSEVKVSPSVYNGNRLSRSIGLGQMNLHGSLIRQGIDYASQEARSFFEGYIARITYEVISSSMRKALETDSRFAGFVGSRWEDGSYIDAIRSRFEQTSFAARQVAEVSDEDWFHLRQMVSTYGVYNQNLQAIPPTGSISYINNATASIHPITAPVEIRKEGKIGRVYYPAYGMTNENFSQVRTAYQYGPEAVIDMYAVAAPYIDQGASLTLFFTDKATTRDVNRAQIYAHKAGVKSIYYIRILQQALEGTEIDGCVSCEL